MDIINLLHDKNFNILLSPNNVCYFYNIINNVHINNKHIIKWYIDLLIKDNRILNTIDSIPYIYNKLWGTKNDMFIYYIKHISLSNINRIPISNDINDKKNI